MKTVLPELLAPAGNPETAVAAYEAGADAVYCGLGRFNARERAENFTFDTLGRVLEFARGKGKKLYLTFNTLLKENELPAAAEMLGHLAELQVDALIVQDPGVIRMVREYFPTLRLHGSTQMGIHNLPGVAAAARLGLSRVILERQVTLEELREIAVASPLELEVFCHGSLCCSLSGRCLLSAALGGWSGNRGKCKQPCRRAYETQEGSKFSLSPQDLCSLDLVGEFRRLGIASLKIEGRLRSPEYVFKTVQAYRMVLDGPEEPPPELLAEASALIAATATRRLSHGFYFSSGMKKLIDADRPGVFGQPVAQVDKALHNGLLITAGGKLHLGDRLRLVPPDGGEGESFSLIRLEERPGVPVVRLRSKSRGFLPGKFNASPGWLIYKIGENGYDFSRQAASLPPGRHRVNLKLQLSADEWRGSIEELPGKEWKEATGFSPAQKRVFSETDASREFASGVPEPWAAGKITVTVSGNFFVPVSKLKNLRRDFWAWAAGELAPEALPDRSAAGLLRFCREMESLTPAPEAPLPEGPLCELPAFIPQKEVASMREKIRRMYDQGCRTFTAGSFGTWELVRDLKGITLIGKFPLPVANSQAAKLLAELNFRQAESEPELEEAALAELKNHAPLSLYRSADRLPLLVSRLPLIPGKWLDRRGREFECRFDPQEKLFKLYAAGESRTAFLQAELK